MGNQQQSFRENDIDESKAICYHLLNKLKEVDQCPQDIMKEDK